MIKKLSVVIGILLILLINISFSSAITGAMGNAKMVLYPEVNGWTNTVIEKSILVKNANDVPINITLKLDEEGENFLELVDKSFILEPRTEREAQFLVKVKTEGTYQSKINVFFSSVDGQKAGVALASEITVIAKKDQGYDETNDENTDTNAEEKNSTETTDGEVVSGEKQNSILVPGLMMGGFFILLLVVVVLITLLLKRSKKGEKRRKKVNARRKV